MKINVNETLIRLVFVLSAGMLGFTNVLGSSRTKYCLYLIVLLFLAELIVVHIRWAQLPPLMLALASCIVAYFLYGGNPASYLVFILSLTFACHVFNAGVSEETWNVMKLVTLVVAGWFLFALLSGRAGYENGRLMLGFDNPNMTGIALTAPAMFLVLMAVEEKQKGFRVVCCAMAAGLTYMVLQTENRGSALTVIVFVVFAVLAVKKRPIRVTGAAVYAVLKLMPIIMMLVYVSLYSFLPHDLEFMDKPFFSGRESLWAKILVQITIDPFAHSSYEEGGLNLFLGGAARYGLVAMVGFFWLLFTFAKADLKTAPIRNYLAYLGFHLCLFQQSFESTLITGSYSVYIWTYLLLGVAAMRPPEQTDT